MYIDNNDQVWTLFLNMDKSNSHSVCCLSPALNDTNCMLIPGKNEAYSLVVVWCGNSQDNGQ